MSASSSSENNRHQFLQLSSPHPPGWTVVYSEPVSSSSIIFKHSNIGLYDTEKDLRHFGEGELFLTETKITLCFHDAKNSSSSSTSSSSTNNNPGTSNNNNNKQLEFIGAKYKLFLEMNLSAVDSFKWLGGFAMFSSPKVQLTLKNNFLALPRLSFRNGGVEEFVKHLEICLKKRAWLENNAAAAAINSSNENRKGSAMIKNNENDTGSTFATRKAGIAGVLASQTERTNQLRETIKSSTTGEIDSLIVKSKELQSLMDRFKEEVAKGDYKLCSDQIDQLKKLDARFSLTTSSSNTTSSTSERKVNELLIGSNNNTNNNSSSSSYSSSHTVKEISKDLFFFIKTDSVTSSAFRVPLVELFAAFNTARGFGNEIEPSLFHESVCDMVKNYPEKRILSLIITNTTPAPSFALRNDHLVQCHVLARSLPLLEKSLGPRPFFSLGFKLDEDKVKNYKSINVIQCARVLKVPVDEAKQILHQLEMHEGVLLRDEHPSVGIRFAWNLMCIL